MLEIDGGMGEGGGQILRTALALSTLTKQPFRMANIRKGRCNPGLKHEHLCCVEALQKMSGASVEHAMLGSTDIIFSPGVMKKGTYAFDIGTAGSITLVLQALLLPCIFGEGKTRLKIKGGTDVKWSQPIDYFQQVFLPHLRRFAELELNLELRGYYPKGGGKIDFTIKPKCSYKAFMNNKCNKETFPGIELLSQGKLLQVKGISHAAQELEKQGVAGRQAVAAKHGLSLLQVPVDIRNEYQNTDSIGSGIALFALFSEDEEFDYEKPIILGADALGEKTKRAEDVGREAAERLINEIKCRAPVDEYLADNLIPFIAVAGGKMKISKISQHTLTNIQVVEMFLGKLFSVDVENKIIEVKK